MSRIAATIDGFQQFLLTRLARSNQATAESLFRTSTGRRVNFPADNPSAFLQISTFETRAGLLTSLRANVTAAASIGAGLQTTLDEVRTQLNTIRTALVADEDNLLTSAEKSTNQGTVDSAISEIRSLARTAIDGRRFLDGSVDHTFSGKDPNQITGIQVFSLYGDTTISGSVATAATRSAVRYTGAGGNINSGNATVTVTGKRGATTISVTNGESLTAVRDRINLDSHLTGITAAVSGDNLDLTTVDYGAAATITLNVTAGTFSTSTIATGADAVVTIDGESISSDHVDGNRVSYFRKGVHLAIDFAAGFTGAFSSVTISRENVAQFALTTRASERIQLALPGVFPELLGGVSGVLSDLESGGTLAGLGTNSAQAIRVVDEALGQLATIEGRVNGFADISVASADRLLAAFQSNVDDTLDTLNSVDEAEESVIVARQQTLSDNTLAALSLLQQQQRGMLELLRMLAGLD